MLVEINVSVHYSLSNGSQLAMQLISGRVDESPRVTTKKLKRYYSSFEIFCGDSWWLVSVVQESVHYSLLNSRELAMQLISGRVDESPRVTTKKLKRYYSSFEIFCGDSWWLVSVVQESVHHSLLNSSELAMQLISVRE